MELVFALISCIPQIMLVEACWKGVLKHAVEFKTRPLSHGLEHSASWHAQSRDGPSRTIYAAIHYKYVNVPGLKPCFLEQRIHYGKDRRLSFNIAVINSRSRRIPMSGRRHVGVGTESRSLYNLLHKLCSCFVFSKLDLALLNESEWRHLI